MNSRSGASLTSLLVCPVCKGALEFSSEAVSCTSCERRFPPPDDGCIDVLPDDRLDQSGNRWEERQQEMERWYHDLIADPEWASSCFTNDYGPYAPLLATLSGTVLDLGGGNGITRHYLPSDVQYVVLDPSLDWLACEWANLAEDFPCLGTPPRFVRGVGEYLPFRPRSFDAVLALWSLNHVSRPDRVLLEVNRVLKPGGLFLAVLEEMEPSWRDLFDPSFRRGTMPQIAWSLQEQMKPLHRRLIARIARTEKLRQAAVVLLEKLRCALPRQTWPTQADHIRIRESDLVRWSRGRFKIARRAWTGRYLTYEFRRLPTGAELSQPR